MTEDQVSSSTIQQLESLYEEKDRLRQELGVATADEIIDMVRSLQEQVEALYDEKHHEN